MSLRDEKREFILYRNGAKRSYIAFGTNISHERSEYIAKPLASRLYSLYIMISSKMKSTKFA